MNRKEYIYKKEVECGDKDYIIRKLLKILPELNLEELQLVKLFFPSPAKIYFKLKYIQEPHCVIDKLEKFHTEDFVEKCQQIKDEAKVPVLVIRKNCSELYGWDKGFSLFTIVTKNTLESWLEKHLSNYSEEVINEFVSYIEDDINKYDVKISLSDKKEWSLDQNVDYLLFSILVINKSKIASEHGYNTIYMKNVEHLIFLTLNYQKKIL